MTLYRRISDILSANLNDLVDHLENPEKMLRQSQREVDNAVAAATSATARAIAGQKLLTQEIEMRHESAERWRRKAVSAAGAGDDAEARRAIARRRQHERLLDSLKKQRDAAQATVARLRRRIEAMRLKRAEANRLLVELAARQYLAQADRRLAALASSDVPGQFERWRRRAALAEAEAEVFDELADGDGFVDDADDESAAIELELLEIKRHVP